MGRVATLFFEAVGIGVGVVEIGHSWGGQARLQCLLFFEAKKGIYVTQLKTRGKRKTSHSTATLFSSPRKGSM